MSEQSLFNFNGAEQPDLLMESWCFHGFGGGGPEGFQEFVSPPVFRFVRRESGTIYDVSRVNRMGWRVSRYTIERVTEEKMNGLIGAANWDDFYKVYRARPVIDQVNL